MGKRKQKLKPDIVVKNYWRNNEQFADFFNAVLFDGKEIIKADELEDIDTEESSILEHKDYAESIGAARDNVKIRKKSTIYNVELVILGMEGQERIHYAMPMRVMGYDYGTYKKQYDDNAKKYKNANGMSRDEYMSKMKKMDKFIPVITIVVYYGENPWDGALSLHEMLNIPKEVEPFVNDYKMHLIEARKNNLKLHNINNIDLFNLLEILLNKDEKLKETKEKAIQYASEHDVDKSVIMTVAGAANCKMDYDMIAGKGSVDMCTVFEETRFEGRLEGRLEGKLEGRAEEIIETGHEFGLSEEEILIRLQKKLDVSLQKAQEYFKMFSK
ncbi:MULTISPECIES: Rpn family recombination-promoting nuclease/putative transposase [Clostridia]|jgi:hypothetical protein|nr:MULTISPECIES: Rpn family recombination-promoting nuclease/putative transposase [Clostridia]RHP28137.1 transposase [Clostridium sp. AF34-13]RHU73899.1 transposase [Butyribacter intestini]UYJ41981.1 MAG: Rpn family recombination-promoting nuclease/putative transposase [Lachnospiraceae bacterium]